MVSTSAQCHWSVLDQIGLRNIQACPGPFLLLLIIPEASEFPLTPTPCTIRQNPDCLLGIFSCFQTCLLYFLVTWDSLVTWKNYLVGHEEELFIRTGGSISNLHSARVTGSVQRPEDVVLLGPWSTIYHGIMDHPAMLRDLLGCSYLDA